MVTAVTTMEVAMSRGGRTLLALVLLIALPVVAFAQTSDNQAPQANQPQPATPTQPAEQLLKPEQVEALVAPIALYPDDLLANRLAGSTYPLEVVKANRWANSHKNLKGDALKKEVDKQAWDDSVKALVSTASVLSMMSEK